MPQHSNRFNDRFLRRHLAENQPNSSFSVVDPNRGEKQYETQYKGVLFVVNRDHAYRDHATGPSTNPKFSGIAEGVESAIIEDAFDRWRQGKLTGMTRIAAGGPGIIFRHIPIRYNATVTDDGKIVISDYMVWQGTVGNSETWETAVSQDWKRYG